MTTDAVRAQRAQRHGDDRRAEDRGDGDPGSGDPSDDRSSRGDDGSGGGEPDPSKPVRRAIGVVSRYPGDLLGFALAAVVVALADAARVLDPVGNAVPSTLGEGISLGVMTHPSGTRVAIVRPGALVGLEPQWLVATVALALVGPVAAGLATSWTVARATKREVTRERVVATTTYVLAVVVAWESAGVLVELVPPLGGPLLLVGLWLAARLFPAPALAAIDRSPLDAASEAYALTSPRSVWLAISVLGVGTLAAVLANLPSAAAVSTSDPLFALGTFLSYAVAGTVGAVASAIYAVEARKEREYYRERRDAGDAGDAAAAAERGNGN